MASKSESVFELKSRIKELESQVSDYKKRLDELRKAKNTTVLKREREVLEVGGPNLGQRRPGNHGDLSRLQREMSELKVKHDQEMKKLESNIPKETNCDHEPLIQQLKRRIEELEGDNCALLMENTDMRERAESLMLELSTKEAQWCETEEQLNLKLKQQWGEKYREWMEKTEAKLAELQEANTYLRNALMKKKPKEDS